MKRILAVLCVLVAGALMPLSAAADEANVALVDAADATSDANGCGTAVNQCNTIAAGLSRGTSVVRVAAGTYEENIFVGRNVQILGEGAEQTIVDGGGTGRVFHVKGATVKIADLTVTNGYSNFQYEGGAGIYNEGGQLTLERVTISGNWARYCGALYNGHWVLPRGELRSRGSATLQDVVVAGNTASRVAGICNIADFTMEGGAIQGNISTDMDASAFEDYYLYVERETSVLRHVRINGNRNGDETFPVAFIIGPGAKMDARYNWWGSAEGPRNGGSPPYEGAIVLTAFFVDDSLAPGEVELFPWALEPDFNNFARDEDRLDPLQPIANGWNALTWVGAGISDLDLAGFASAPFIQQLWAFDAVSQKWVGYLKELPAGMAQMLNTLEQGAVVFVKASSPTPVLLDQNDALPQEARDGAVLKSRWNLIGFFGIRATAMEDLLAPVATSVRSAWKFDAEEQRWLLYTTSGPSFLNEFTEVAPYEALFIYNQAGEEVFLPFP